jgi:NAD(P)-dependent dehydrogenase (short-subunit alcohol dehydrogenase family)
LGEPAVITGTTHGIGRITSRELARAGRSVVMLCRNLDAAQAVREEICGEVPTADLHVIHCDLASLASVRTCASEVRERFPRIGLLINNAGMVSVRRHMSVDGFELTFATNHLGPFLLTALLSDRLTQSARVINVASRVHYRAHLNLGAVSNPRARYSSTAAYAQSKLANVLHTFALARRLKGTGISVNCLHPGVVKTNLLPRWVQLIKPLLSPVILDDERGAQTTIHLALADSVAGISGVYFDENQIPQPGAPSALDEALQESLWAASCQWTGLAS